MKDNTTHSLIQYQSAAAMDNYRRDISETVLHDMFGNERADHADKCLEIAIDSFYVGYIAGIRAERKRK